MNQVNEPKRGPGVGLLLTGVAIGTALGLLFAPKSGDETREDVAEWTRRNREKARNLLSRNGIKIPNRVKVAAAYGAAKEGGEEAIEDVKDRVSEALK